MKKNKVQNIVIIVVATLIIGSIIAYNYSVDQTKQKGLQFGNELSQIQQEVIELQTRFYSEKIKLDEGDISKEELLEYYETHLKEFERIISRYDDLTPPETFQGAVDLFKLSSQTQMKSDIEWIKWIATGDESAKIRSDAQIQEAYEYENLGLGEFQLAKKGIKNYDEDEKFSEPDKIIRQKVLQISNNMKQECDLEFKNNAGEFDTEQIEIQWFNCVNDAEKWEKDHMP